MPLSPGEKEAIVEEANLVFRLHGANIRRDFHKLKVFELGLKANINN